MATVTVTDSSGHAHTSTMPLAAFATDVANKTDDKTGPSTGPMIGGILSPRWL
jgi:hypothetical protein